MPASPSFPSETRTKWKKRKREPQINRRQKHDEEDEDEEDNHDDDLDPQNDSEDPQSDAVPLDPNGLNESEVLSDAGARIFDFPPVVRHAVNRPHSSVLAIAALKRANESGESKGQNSMVLENVSYGQLQALSAVPADCPVFDQDRMDGAAATAAAYVITPPQIMEGRGVVKRYGSRVHVVPMHSGT
nr:SWI/SNF complex subunit SWI3C-like [Quercus suber]POE70509.1 swi/snf complex subunit swi3c [Quercus suber]